MITPEKNMPIAVLGHRYNPQLGSYVTGPYIGKIVRVNKQSFTIKFDKDSDNSWYPKTFNFYGNATKRTNSVYGSMRYEAHTVAAAKNILEHEISKYDPECLKVKNLKNAIDKLQTL